MLELKNISYSAEGKEGILKNISLSIADNEFVVITGPNGGGKSTLAKMIAGIISPKSGQILLDGQQKQASVLLFNNPFVSKVLQYTI